MKKYSYLDIVDAVNVEVTVECNQCEKIDGDWNTDDVEFSKELFRKGWRFVKKDLLCPKCFKNLTKVKK